MSVNGSRPSDARQGAACPVQCARCGAAVLAVKFSPQHTTVQWTASAVRACVEFGAAGRPSALLEGCASLRDSIDAAVAAGRLEVSPPSYRAEGGAAPTGLRSEERATREGDALRRPGGERDDAA